MEVGWHIVVECGGGGRGWSPPVSPNPPAWGKSQTLNLSRSSIDVKYSSKY